MRNKKLKKDIEPVRHNYEAVVTFVVTFEEYCDKRDQYYI